MKRTQLGFFLLFFAFLGHGNECTISLTDVSRQWAQLAALVPDARSISKMSLDDPLNSGNLETFFPVMPAILTADSLKKIVFYVASTNRYQTLKMTLHDDELLITLIPHLIFDRAQANQFGSTQIAHEYLLKPGMVFNEQLHHQALDALENSYKQKGYAEVRVQSELKKNADQGSVQVQLEVEKGSRSSRNPDECTRASSSFTFEGNKAVSSAQLEQLLLMYGDAIDRIPAAVKRQVITNWYTAHDYHNVQVQYEDFNKKFVIHEGAKDQPAPTLKSELVIAPQHQFGHTVLKKLSRIPDEYIMREISYDEHMLYNPEQIAQTHKRLSRLQVFDRIHLYPVKNPFDSDAYTMILEVRDDEQRELRTRAGLSLQQMSKEFQFKNVQYSAGGTFLIKNPSNRADLFFVDADYTYGEQILSLNYHYPWLGGYPFDARFQVYAMQYLQPGLHHNHKNIYSFAQQGALMGLYYEKDNVSAQINYGVEWMETKLKNCHDYPLFCLELSRALNFTPFLLDKRVPFVFIEPTIVCDWLDDQINPTQGSLSMITLKGMAATKSFGAQSSLVKIIGDHAYFVPFKYAILGVRARVGHIFFRRLENVMPAERFYLGGANSIRSYDTDLCPPLGVLTTDEGIQRFVPQGAQSMANLNIELRIPAKRNLWFAIFQDMGALSNTKFADIKMKHVLAGTGAGIRIQTPIGPLRFDFAFKWHRANNDMAPYCWFLSFGNAF